MTAAFEMHVGTMQPVPNGFYFMDSFGDVYFLRPMCEPGQPFLIEPYSKRPVDHFDLTEPRIVTIEF